MMTVGLSIVIVGGLGLLPAKTWLAQRASIAEAEADLVRLEAESAESDNQLSLLQTDAEVERIARQNFDLVYPGEESYRILPPASE